MPPSDTPPQCKHLGLNTGQTIECSTCRGRVRLKVFDCAVKGSCTLRDSDDCMYREDT
jgi:hypothetical protein